MNAHHRNGGGKTPFGTKVIIAFVLVLAIMIAAYIVGSHT